MGKTDELLEDIRDKIKPEDGTLEAARKRRDEVLAAARSADGWLRSYVSGSIGHRTANNDTDADCGVVLDRRVHQDLGPDGADVGPEDIVQSTRDMIREVLKKEHSDIKTQLTKRAIKFEFHEPLGTEDEASDPSVDLIIALTRTDAEGLWIPNREAGRWDASHPEEHTKLLTDPPDDLRRIRAKTIRAVKAWNKQYTSPALVSFNIEALALETITDVMHIGEAVTQWFEYSASELKKANTKDPADISPSIKLLLDRDAVVARLEGAAKHMRDALDHDDDDDAVTEALAVVFYKFVEKPEGGGSKAAVASALRNGNTGFNRAGAYVAGAGASQIRRVRSHGNEEGR